MELQEVKDSIRNGESSRVEFKRKIDYPDKVAREVVAFSNTRGGKLFVGIDDEGVIRGLKNPEGDLYLLKTFIDTKIKPRLEYSWEVIKVNEKKGIICFEIPEGKKKPHYILSEVKPFKRSFVRVADQSIKASREMRMILSRQRNSNGVNIYYDDYVASLLKYLGTYNSVTVSEAKELLEVSRRKASGILIKLTLAKIVKLIPGAGEDKFVKQEAPAE